MRKYTSQRCLSPFCVEFNVLKSYPTPCNPMDCRPPGTSAHGILQARILEWPFPSPGDLPNPGIERGSPTLQADTLPCLSHQGSPVRLEGLVKSLKDLMPTYLIQGLGQHSSSWQDWAAPCKRQRWPRTSLAWGFRV